MTVRLAFLRPKAEPVLSEAYEEVKLLLGDLLADGQALATYIENRWHMRGTQERFSSVEFRDPVNIHFARGDGAGSRALGPYEEFNLLDGIAYADGHVFAFFDKERQDWYSRPLGGHWSTMIVSGAVRL
jgi:hypothetical protein